jgi:hypothetical protein
MMEDRIVREAADEEPTAAGFAGLGHPASVIPVPPRSGEGHKLETEDRAAVQMQLPTD